MGQLYFYTNLRLTIGQIPTKGIQINKIDYFYSLNTLSDNFLIEKA